jgi:hypothetical protein
METPFENKCEILAQLWLEYRNDAEFEDFIAYNDLGLPLAYAISNGIVETSSMAEAFVNEAFSLLLSGLEIDEDTGFDCLEDMLEISEND